MSKCECGCGGEASPGCRFILGHHSRVNNSMKGKHQTEESKQKTKETKKINREIKEGKRLPNYCGCGCGQIVKYGKKFISGHNGKGETKENNERVRKLAEKLAGKTPTLAMIEGHKRGAEKLRGRTKENDESKRRTSEKLTGRTKENNESVRRGAEKYKETCKNPTLAMIEGYKKISKAKKGRTKENDEGHRKQSETRKGWTKENHEGTRKQAEKMRGRTKENNEGYRKISEANINRIGDKSPAWKGGIAYLPYCEKFDNNFKNRVREFFNCCCYVCGKSEEDNKRKLDVHHVNYNKDTCCDDSKPLFVPLCRSCHSKTQSDREYWKEFFIVSLEYLTNNKCFYTKEEMEELKK